MLQTTTSSGWLIVKNETDTTRRASRAYMRDRACEERRRVSASPGRAGGSRVVNRSLGHAGHAGFASFASFGSIQHVLVLVLCACTFATLATFQTLHCERLGSSPRHLLVVVSAIAPGVASRGSPAARGRRSLLSPSRQPITSSSLAHHRPEAISPHQAQSGAIRRYPDSADAACLSPRLPNPRHAWTRGAMIAMRLVIWPLR